MQGTSIPSEHTALAVTGDLPKGALLDPSPPGYTERFKASGAIWFCSEPSLFWEENDETQSPDWIARGGEKAASPSKPNTGNSSFSEVSGISCLAFSEGVNCGYHVPRAIKGSLPYSLALIYAPIRNSEPRTLVTINPPALKNYLFLSERDGAIELADDKGSFMLRHSLSGESDGFRLVVMSFGSKGVKLVAANPEFALEHDHRPDFEGADPCDIFVGCRSHRAGIVKTLGAFALADLFFWPEKDILANTIKKTEDEPELDLLRRYYTEIIARDL